MCGSGSQGQDLYPKVGWWWEQLKCEGEKQSTARVLFRKKRCEGEEGVDTEIRSSESAE